MEELSKKIVTGKYEPLPASTSPDLQRLVRQLLALEPKARPDISQLLGQQVVQDHMHLLPTVPKSSRMAPVPKPSDAFMDLRNTIHTPRRMGDMKHLLPVETRYDQAPEVKGHRGERSGRRRATTDRENGERTRTDRVERRERGDRGERSERRTRTARPEEVHGGGSLLPPINSQRSSMGRHHTSHGEMERSKQQVHTDRSRRRTHHGSRRD